MREHENCEWNLKPDTKQLWLDAAVMAVPIYVVWRLWFYPNFSKLLLLTLCLGVMVWAIDYIPWLDKRAEKVGRENGIWWVECAGIRRNIKICDHSIKRENLVILRGSLLPWRTLVLRARNFDSTDEFRRFRASLYGEL